MKDDLEASFESHSRLIYYDLKGFADSSPPALNMDELSAMQETDRPQMSKWCINNTCVAGLQIYRVDSRCYHVTGDGVGQVRHGGVGIVAAAALVGGLTSGAAACFTWSPV